MNWQTLRYLIPYLISLAISITIGVYAWRRRAVAGAAPFAITALAEASWALGYVFELVSPSVEAKIFWDDVQWIGALVWPMASLALALEYTGRKLSRPQRTWGLLAIVPTIFLLLVLTDDLHRLVRPAVWLVPGEPFSALVYDFSVSVWVIGLYAYGLILSGAFLLVAYLVRSPRLYRAQVGTIVVGTLVPVVGTVLTLMGITFTFHRDTTPFTFAISNLVIAWGLFRYYLFDVVPMAHGAVIENMRDVVIVLDAQNRVVDLNPAAQDVVGCTASEAIGRPAAQVFSDWPDLVEQYRDIEKAHAEIVIGDGESRRYFILNLSPLHNRRGRFTGRLIVAHDVTELKQAEVAQSQVLAEALQATHALQESEAKFRSLVSNISDVTWTTDYEGRFTFISSNVEKVYGYTPDVIFQAGADLWLGRIHPDDVKRVEQAYGSLFARNEMFDVEYRIQRKDGHWIWLRDRAIATYEKDGVMYADGMFSDITERKQAQEALQQERDFISAVLDTVGALVVVLDRQGHIVRFNRACEQVTGYLFDEVKGKHPWDLFLIPEEVDSVKAVFGELQAGQFPNENENYWLAKDGSRRLIAWSNTVLLDRENGGSVEYIICTGIDIEEERRREWEARVLAEMAKLVSGTLDLEEVLDRTVGYAMDTFQVDRCLIGLYDEIGGTLQCAAERGFPPRVAAAFREEELRFTDRTHKIVMEALQPLIIEDLFIDPHVDHQEVESLGLQSVMIVPVEMGERRLGLVLLGTQRGQRRRFTAGEGNLALAMISQAAMAIDNARYYKAEQRRAEQFRVINEVGRHITSILAVDDLLQEIVRLVKDALGYYLVGIGLLEEDELVFKAGAGAVWETPGFQPPRLKVGQEGITGWVARSGEPLLVPDVGQEPRYYSLPQVSGIRSELAVPLKTGERVIGVLHAQSDQLDGFDESDLVVLQSLAHQAAIAIENARLYTSAQQELTARRQAEEALQRAHDELERRVEERTAELARANASLKAEIVERKRAEEALQESESKYRSLVNTTNDLVFIVDARGHVLFANPSAEWFTGHTPEETVGRSFVEYVHPDDAPDLLAGIQQALGGEPPDGIEGIDLDAEYRMVKQNGEVIWVSTRSRPLRDAQGQIVGFSGICRDITESKRAEEALRKSEALFRAIVEDQTEFIVRWSPDGTYTFVNDAYCHYVNQERDELIGTSYFSLLEEEHLEDLLKTVGPLTPENPVVFDEHLTKFSDGRVVWQQWTDRAIFDETGRLIEYQSVGRDITERKQAEEELKQYREHLEELVEARTAELEQEIAERRRTEEALRQATDRAKRSAEAAEEARIAAEAANRAKSQFLANMSHELRTPLNAILGFTQLMRRDSAFLPSQRENLRVIHRSGEYLLELINDVLEMSKIEAGRATFTETDFDLYQLLDALESMFGIRAQNKGLQLYFERAPDVPQHIRTDERKLRQVLINLLSNAAKFTGEGSVTLRVKQVSGSAGQRVTELTDRPFADSLVRLFFEVEDTGAGIALEEMEHLFEAFTQTASGQKVLEGTGLGLALSRRFVQSMGGDITVESQVGQGSVFRFDIQVGLAEASAVEPRRPAQRVVGLAPGEGATDGTPYRILVVEDREASRALLVQLLTAVGFEVREAVNGEEAVAVWEAWEPRLIWMDMRMPVMDGYEATRRIKATVKGQATTIIALTASAFEEDRAEVLSAGCDDFVRKPFQEAEVFDKMAKHLGVCYVYEELAPPSELVGEPVQVVLTSDDLATLPADWIADLRRSAMRGEAEQIFDLVGQIESEHTSLARALTQLVHEFRFDKLVALTESQTG